MKKLTAFILALVCAFGMAGCGENKTASIEFPFGTEEITNIEMFRFSGAPVSAEKKVITAEEDIKSIYDMFERLELTKKEAEETDGADVTSFRFNLADGTDYELIYVCYGVKNGMIKSSDGNFEYFTSADIGACWKNTDLEAVPADENELPG